MPASMSNILSIDRLGKSLGDRLLFCEASFGLNTGEKLGLIGVNGCGKSTLLRMIAGMESPDTGKITTSKNLGVTYFAQLPDFEPDDTIIQHIFKSDAPLIQLVKKYEEISNAIELATKAGNDSRATTQQRNLENVLQEIQDRDAFAYEESVHNTLRELGIHDLHQPMRELSGGKLKKVSLAQALIDPGGLLLLDEPTNHLDIETVIWLQDYLERTERALIMVTHDRYFLDEVVGQTIEIDNERIYRYEGSYHYYLQKKQEREEQARRQSVKDRSFLNKELDWLNRQPKARGTKQKARIDRYNEIAARKQAPTESGFEFSVSGRRLGKKILETKKISLQFGNQKLFENFSYFFKRNERIGLVGPNGSGKTSLLNILTGIQAPDSGSISKGINTSIGYFDQQARDFQDDRRVLQYVKQEIGEWIPAADGSRLEAARLLEMFQFGGRLQSQPVHRLSGGEKRRLQLVCVLLTNPNFLILDEPTNDLDVETLSRLEAFLDSYAGCVLIVSHDRYFMDRVVDQLLILDGKGNINAFPANFSEYLLFQKEEKARYKKERRKDRAAEAVDRKLQQESNDQTPKKKQRLSFKEKHELSQLEIDIAALESRTVELQQHLATGESDHKILADWSEELQSAQDSIEKKYERWNMLSDSAENIE